MEKKRNRWKKRDKQKNGLKIRFSMLFRDQEQQLAEKTSALQKEDSQTCFCQKPGNSVYCD
jgi:alkyl hydroperoxide reductase subunit AhpC